VDQGSHSKSHTIRKSEETIRHRARTLEKPGRLSVTFLLAHSRISLATALHTIGSTLLKMTFWYWAHVRRPIFNGCIRNCRRERRNNHRSETQIVIILQLSKRRCRRSFPYFCCLCDVDNGKSQKRYAGSKPPDAVRLTEQRSIIRMPPSRDSGGQRWPDIARSAFRRKPLECRTRPNTITISATV
jgi:hypothetical protein